MDRSRVQEYLVNLTLILACACLAVVGYRAIRPAAAAGSQKKKPVDIADWRSIADSGHFLGQRGARVVITEFVDYQCPGCADVARPLADFQAAHPEVVALSIRHYPLESIHPHALTAAVAAACADEQDAFAAYHYALYATQTLIPSAMWTTFASTALMSDTTAFIECMHAQRPLARIRRDQALAEALDLPGTPSIMLNGRLYPLGTPVASIITAATQMLEAGSR